MLVLSSHPASHRPKSLGQVHKFSHAGCTAGDTGTLAPGASVPLSPGERLLVPCSALLCCSALAALSSSACTSTTCAVCRATLVQSSGVEEAQLGKSVLAASLVQAATRLSTDIGHDIDLWPLTFLFGMHSNNRSLLNANHSQGIIGRKTPLKLLAGVFSFVASLWLGPPDLCARPTEVNPSKPVLPLFLLLFHSAHVLCTYCFVCLGLAQV